MNMAGGSSLGQALPGEKVLGHPDGVPDSLPVGRLAPSGTLQLQERQREAEPCLSSFVESCVLTPLQVVDEAWPGGWMQGRAATSADKAHFSPPCFLPFMSHEEAIPVPHLLSSPPDSPEWWSQLLATPVPVRLTTHSLVTSVLCAHRR